MDAMVEPWHDEGLEAATGGDAAAEAYVPPPNWIPYPPVVMP